MSAAAEAPPLLEGDGVVEVLDAKYAALVILASLVMVSIVYVKVIKPRFLSEKVLHYDVEMPKSRERFFFILDNPPSDVNESPHVKFAWTKVQLSELMRWAVEAIQVYDKINRDHFDHQRMYKAGLSNDEMWSSVQFAKKEIDAEMGELVQIASGYNPQAKDTLFRDAAKILQAERQYLQGKTRYFRQKVAEEAKGKGGAEEGKGGKIKDDKKKKKGEKKELSEKEREKLVAQLIEEDEKEQGGGKKSKRKKST